MKTSLALLLAMYMVQTLHSQSPAMIKDDILINQIGYPTQSSKQALCHPSTSAFSIQDITTGKTVYTGLAGTAAYWASSGDSVRLLDFTSVNTPGKYRLVLANQAQASYPFEIADHPYHSLALSTIKAFYFNRCSYPIKPEFGGKWARAAGHPDTAVFIHESAATTQRPANTKLKSSGGWYDAGDYNKYIVNSGISTYTLLLFCQMFPNYCASLVTSIPESKNEIPDVVDEVLVNLKWMLTMQDTDGGVYHKLTNKGFDGMEMPDKTTSARFVVMKTTAATLDFAAVMAKASVVLLQFHQKELDLLSTTCRSAAQKAMQWATLHPNIIYQQASDVHTGGYEDNHLSDEFFWAQAEWSLASVNPIITPDSILQQKMNIPAWAQVNMLGIISLSLDRQFKNLQATASKKLIDYALMLSQKSEKSPFHISIDQFEWGSNSFVANSALTKIVANQLEPSPTLKASIQSDINYLLGNNATGYCFVTGFGGHSPMHIHHRPSAADGVEEPIPGFLVGGPNTATFDDCNDAASRSHFPAKSYSDQLCSYSTNEIAINWNAPMFFLAAALDAGLK